MTEQLPLPFHLPHDVTFTNFIPGKNQRLIAWLQSMLQNELESFVYLWGSMGVGCSHLLQSCCRIVLDKGLTAMYCSMREVLTLTPKLFENLESFSLICLDDIQEIAGHALWEEAVFHLYNRSQISNTSLIIAGNSVPKELGIQLADLVSRLEHGLIFQVHALSDEEKSMALQAHAQSKGIKLSPEICQFLLRHVPRDLRALFQVLEKLDHKSLVEQRKLTIPFVKQILGI